MTHEREGKTLRRKAAGYAHARQFRRLKQTLRRQRTILGSLLRELRRRMDGLAVTHKQGLMVGARSFAGNPYDGHTRAAQLEQAGTLVQDIGTKPTTAIVDLGTWTPTARPCR